MATLHSLLEKALGNAAALGSGWFSDDTVRREMRIPEQTGTLNPVASRPVPRSDRNGAKGLPP